MIFFLLYSTIRIVSNKLRSFCILHLCSVKFGFIISVLTRTKTSIDLEIERVRERKKYRGNYGILFLKRGHISITYMYSVNITQNSWIYRDLLCKYKNINNFYKNNFKGLLNHNDYCQVFD